MAFDNDWDVYEDHAELYHSGKRLILTPHKSPAPFGSSFYPDPPNLTSKQMTPTDEERSFSRTQLVFSESNGPLDFDETKQNDKSSQVHLEILDMVDGGYGAQYTAGPQKVLCKVVQTASASSDDNENKALVLGQLVFLKLYDPLFWPLKVDLSECCFKVAVRAGFAQSNEVGAYSHLFKAGRDPYKAYLYFAKKPHPFIRFSMNRLAPFFGWIPPSWEGQNLGRDTPLFLYRWLAITFGPFVDNPTYTYRGSPPADMKVDAKGTVSQYSLYLENKRLEEKRQLEESKPGESNKPDENSEEKKPREETVLAAEVL
ncbi:hypothetical protein CGCA056_v012593 [Colletotrichum aenigma]|uniref:uncharacterized protein n=1 Tax=Colletotrichum aenigma TaxID=1215731 RepID=UPI0018728441|nr:uncharacterized protein CGCA056_v012593 [Colletotrichum aenigma]KAF5513047.1 hypothetical protein CGCA056_v012593 [Colletotrichum aenigma]